MMSAFVMSSKGHRPAAQFLLHRPSFLQRRRFECTDEFRPAIRIAGIIRDIGPEIDQGRASASACRSEREKIRFRPGT